MKIFILTVIVLMLFIIAFQDFKERRITAILLPTIFFFSVIYQINKFSISEVMENSIINFAILLLQFLLLTVIYSIKSKRVIWIPDKMLGWGDILFLPIIGVYFSPIAMLMFYTLCLILIFILYYLIWYPNENSIPLAGGLSMFLVIYLVVNEGVYAIHNYNDDFLFELAIQ